MNKSCLQLFLLCFIPLTLTFAASPVNHLKLPPGFHIHEYAKVPNARSMTLAPNGTVFVGTLTNGRVFALIPEKNFKHAKQVITIAKGLDMPNGIAYYQGDLYVAENHRIIRYDNILANLTKPPIPTIIINDLPTSRHHGWRYLGFGPKGWMYVAIGAPCNSCLSKDPRYATIMRMKPDGSQQQIFAKGIRNSVGFTWNPNTRVMWFTNNGRDWMGDNFPPDTVNRAPTKGLDFGYPYVDGNNIPNSSFAKLKPGVKFAAPAIDLPAHVAVLGIRFYNGNMFPKSYQNQIIVAEHGSWNRSKKNGYQLELIKLKGNKAISHTPFVTGWLKGQKTLGRPVDIQTLPDGSLLVSDDYNGIVYRITYG